MHDESSRARRESPPPGALSGVRVIDLTTMILGPVATVLLADMGAEVIRIEPPGGDPYRFVGPTRNPGMSAAFLGVNRNKSSVVLDLKTPAGLAALMALVQTADVFLHNMRTSTAERLGIGYDAIRGRRPDIVYAAGVGFGSAGPYADKPAYDDVIQGLSGIAGLASGSDDPPRYMPMVIADKVCGYVLAGSVAMALYRRAVSGRGECIEMPMFETMVQFTLLDHLGGGAFAPESENWGYSRMFSPYHRPLRTRDGFISVIANTDRQWLRLFTLLERADLTDDPRFSTIKARIDNVVALYQIVDACMPQRTTDEWIALLEDADIACGRIHCLPDLVDDPHLRGTGYFEQIAHPSEGLIRNTSIPVRFTNHPGSIRRLAPTLGQDTARILKEIGYSDAQIAAVGEGGRP